MDEMYWLFGHRPLENLQTHVPLPRKSHLFGAVVVFRNIGDYNDVRNFMQRNNNLMGRMYQLLAN